MLGMDVLCQVKLMIDYTRKIVKIDEMVYDLREEEHSLAKVRPVQRVVDRNSSKDCRYLRLEKTIQLEPNTSEFISLEVPGEDNDLIMVYGTHPKVQQGLGFLLRVVGGEVYLPIINDTKERRKLSVGTLLARYEEVKGASEIKSRYERVNKISEALGPDNDNINERMGHKQKLHQLLEKQDWTHLNEQQKSKIFDLILNHLHLLIIDKAKLGLIKQKSAHIMVKDPKPCRSPVHCYPEQAKETINNILRDLEERDVIERSMQRGCCL